MNCAQWMAQICIAAESRPAQDKPLYRVLGIFKTEEEAKAAIEAHKIKAEDTPA